jgi:hypothetical protein
MELSEEMKTNGWVIEVDEFGQKTMYSKKYLYKFLTEDKTDNPLMSSKTVMINLNTNEQDKND